MAIYGRLLISKKGSHHACTYTLHTHCTPTCKHVHWHAIWIIKKYIVSWTMCQFHDHGRKMFLKTHWHIYVCLSHKRGKHHGFLALCIWMYSWINSTFNEIELLNGDILRYPSVSVGSKINEAPSFLHPYFVTNNGSTRRNLNWFDNRPSSSIKRKCLTTNYSVGGTALWNWMLQWGLEGSHAPT